MSRLSKKRRRKKKQKIKKGLPLIVFVVVVFCICVGVKAHSLKKERDELAAKQEMLEKQIKNEEERAEELAREKLGLVYPDEILIEPKK